MSQAHLSLLRDILQVYKHIHKQLPLYNDLVSSEGRDFRQVESGSVGIPDHE